MRQWRTGSFIIRETNASYEALPLSLGCCTCFFKRAGPAVAVRPSVLLCVALDRRLIDRFLSARTHSTNWRERERTGSSGGPGLSFLFSYPSINIRPPSIHHSANVESLSGPAVRIDLLLPLPPLIRSYGSIPARTCIHKHTPFSTFFYTPSCTQSYKPPLLPVRRKIKNKKIFFWRGEIWTRPISAIKTKEESPK